MPLSKTQILHNLLEGTPGAGAVSIDEVTSQSYVKAGGSIIFFTHICLWIYSVPLIATISTKNSHIRKLIVAISMGQMVYLYTDFHHHIKFIVVNCDTSYLMPEVLLSCPPNYDERRE